VAQLLDTVEGRSRQAFKAWLGERDTYWRDGIEVLRWTGSPVSRPPPTRNCPTRSRSFQFVRLAGDALDQCRRRVQQVSCGHRGRKDDPLYAALRTLHTGAAPLTEKQRARLEALFAVSEHVEVEATWGIYQRMIAAYREPDKQNGKAMMQAVIDSVASGVPATLTEIRSSAGPSSNAPRTPSRSSTGPARRTAPPRPSTAGSNTSAAAPSDSGTDELHRTLVARSRRIQTPTTPSIAMSPHTGGRTPVAQATSHVNATSAVWHGIAGVQVPSGGSA
jgi:hypothetical protein